MTGCLKGDGSRVKIPHFQSHWDWENNMFREIRVITLVLSFWLTGFVEVSSCEFPESLACHSSFLVSFLIWKSNIWAVSQGAVPGLRAKGCGMAQTRFWAGLLRDFLAASPPWFGSLLGATPGCKPLTIALFHVFRLKVCELSQGCAAAGPRSVRREWECGERCVPGAGQGEVPGELGRGAAAAAGLGPMDTPGSLQWTFLRVQLHFVLKGEGAAEGILQGVAGVVQVMESPAVTSGAALSSLPECEEEALDS